MKPLKTHHPKTNKKHFLNSCRVRWEVTDERLIHTEISREEFVETWPYDKRALVSECIRNSTVLPTASQKLALSWSSCKLDKHMHHLSLAYAKVECVSETTCGTLDKNVLQSLPLQLAWLYRGTWLVGKVNMQCTVHMSSVVCLKDHLQPLLSHFTQLCMTTSLEFGMIPVAHWCCL